MTVAPHPTPPHHRSPAPRAPRTASGCHDVAVLTRRNLVHVRREPAQLSDATVQPVLFTVLFVYIFGVGDGHRPAARYTHVRHRRARHDEPHHRRRWAPRSGEQRPADRRDRPLPHAADGAQRDPRRAHAVRPAGQHPVRHDRADHRLRHRLAARQRHRSACIAGLAVAVLFAYALSWFTACIGLRSNDPESAQGIGLPASSSRSRSSPAASCRPRGCPGWLQPIADWNPVSAVAGALRELFGNPNPAALVAQLPDPAPGAHGDRVERRDPRGLHPDRPGPC